MTQIALCSIWILQLLQEGIRTSEASTIIMTVSSGSIRRFMKVAGVSFAGSKPIKSDGNDSVLFLAKSR